MERKANIGAACGDPDPVFKRVYQQVFNLESFHALPHQPALHEVMKMLAGDQVLVHPKPIGRLIFRIASVWSRMRTRIMNSWGAIRSSLLCGFLFTIVH